ncbi:MAG: alpha/beta hydrolase [Gemmatimonadota bacterium]
MVPFLRPFARPRSRFRRHVASPLRTLRRSAPSSVVRLAGALLVAWLVVAPRAAAQGGSQGDLLVLLSGGGDTISVERFTRTPGRLEGELLIASANARFSYAIDVDAQGGATRLVNEYRQATAPLSSEPLQHADVHFVRDSAIVELSGGGKSTTQRFATRPGALPFLNPSFAQVELVLQRARHLGGDSVDVAVWAIQGGQTTMAQVVRRGADSVVVIIGGIPLRLAVNAAGAITGGSVPSQGLRLVRAHGAAAGAMSVAPPDYSAPPGAPYTAEEVTVTTPAGHTLAGTLTMPRGATAPVPAVVTITGSGPQDRDEAIPPVKGYRPMRQVADTLSRHGIAVLRLDDRGTGSSKGDFAAATSADFAADVRAALAYLRQRPDVDGARLALVGHSEGGLIAPMVAATDPALRGIVLLAGPAKTGRVILQYQLGAGVDRSPTMSAAQRDSARRKVDATIDSLGATQPWMRYFLAYDPLPTARRVKVPTLILQGATDRQVTADQAEMLERALREGGNRQVTRRVFTDTDHLFLRDADGTPAGYAALPDHQVRADVLAAMLDWLQARLR